MQVPLSRYHEEFADMADPLPWFPREYIISVPLSLVTTNDQTRHIGLHVCCINFTNALQFVDFNTSRFIILTQTVWSRVILGIQPFYDRVTVGLYITLALEDDRGVVSGTCVWAIVLDLVLQAGYDPHHVLLLGVPLKIDRHIHDGC